MQRRPDTFIIGGAKCGTTSMYEYLKGHPEVFMSPAKEPRYFSADLISHSDHDLRHPVDEQRYLELFADARDEKRLGEASVRYLYSKAAPRLIHQFQPDAYIIVMLRNPVDMLHSMHQQRLSEVHDDILDFEEALAADEDRRQGRRVPYGQNPVLSLYKPRAMFGEQLPRWLDEFGDRVHIIVLEDFLNDQQGEWRRLLAFLEVDPDYLPPSFVAYNRSHASRSRLLYRLTKSRLPQWLARQALPRLVGERMARRLIRRYRHSPINRRRAGREPMSPQLRRRLEGEFAPDVARVSSLLGRDLSELWFNRPLQPAGSQAEQAAGNAA